MKTKRHLLSVERKQIWVQTETVRVDRTFCLYDFVTNCSNFTVQTGKNSTSNIVLTYIGLALDRSRSRPQPVSLLPSTNLALALNQSYP